MRIIERAARTLALVLTLTTLGACSSMGGLGGILGSVLGSGSGTDSGGQLNGTVRGLDTRNQQIAIQQSNGQTVSVGYDNQTQIVYQNQNYPVTALENGDQVTARVQANGNSYYTDLIQVTQSVSTSGSSTANAQPVQGTVRQIDRTNGWFTIDASNGARLNVSLPYRLTSTDASKFQNLRSGDYVRFYGVYLNNTQVELRQFY